MALLEAATISTAVAIGATLGDVVTWVTNESVSVGTLQTNAAASSQAITIETGDKTGGGGGRSGRLRVTSTTEGDNVEITTGYSAGTTPGSSGNIVLAPGNALVAGLDVEGRAVVQYVGITAGPILSMGFSLVAPEILTGAAVGAAEAAFTASDMTVPANYLKVGSSIRFRAFITQDGAGASTHIFRIRYGGLAGAILAESETVNLVLNGVGIIEGTMTVRTVVGGGINDTISTVATTTMGATPDTVEAVEIFAGPNPVTNALQPGGFAPVIDTTTDQLLTATIEFGANNSSIRLDQFVVVIAA